jgi:hypothetical protein
MSSTTCYGRSPPTSPGPDGEMPELGYGADRSNNLRSQALTANEQAERMPDDAREHMALTLQSDDDPHGRLERADTRRQTEHEP